MSYSRRDFIAVGIAGAGAVGLAVPTSVQDLAVTPTQRIGPFYPLVSNGETHVDLTREGGGAREAQGSLIEVSGRVLDPQGRPVGGSGMR